MTTLSSLSNTVNHTCNEIAGAHSRRGFLCALILFTTISTLLPGALFAQAEKQTLQAAFLYRFLFFVDWPVEKLGSKSQPLVIGVLDKDMFKTLRAQSAVLNVGDRPVVVRYIDNPKSVCDCHVLFIGKSMERHLESILIDTSGSGVLTVSDIERFNETGGMIQFKTVNNRLRFSINKETVDQQGLKLSSKLLKVAVS